MGLIWNSEYDDFSGGISGFPVKEILRVFDISHPEFGVALLDEGGRVACHFSSLNRLLMSEGFRSLGEIESALKNRLSEGDRTYFNAHFSEGTPLTVARKDPEDDLPFFRLEWLPFGAGARCLLIVLDHRRDVRRVSPQERKSLGDTLESLFAERESDRAIRGFVRDLSSVLAIDQPDPHEFVRDILTAEEKGGRVVERIYGSDGRRRDRETEASVLLPPSRLEVIAPGPDRQKAGETSPSLFQTRIRLGLFAGGLVGVGRLCLTGAHYRSVGPGPLGEGIRRAGDNVASRPAVSHRFAIFRHFLPEYGAFALESLPDILGAMEEGSTSVVGVPLKSVGDHRESLRSRLRTNDVILCDRKGLEGLVLLRGCPDGETARRTVCRDLAARGVPVEMPELLTRQR